MTATTNFVGECPDCFGEMKTAAVFRLPDGRDMLSMEESGCVCVPGGQRPSEIQLICGGFDAIAAAFFLQWWDSLHSVQIPSLDMSSPVARLNHGADSSTNNIPSEG